jgi:uncharacterized membrane protein
LALNKNPGMLPIVALIAIVIIILFIVFAKKQKKRGQDLGDPKAGR